MITKFFRAALVAAAILLSAGSAYAQTDVTGWEKRTMAEVQTAADSGDGKAQWELGKRYYYNKATKDDVKALQWFEKAAKQGVPTAEYETATMYVLGEGTARDPIVALVWYKKSAADGVTFAYADIGVMYLDGDGVAKDEAEAVRWLQRGADAGERRAETLMGKCYRDGKGVPVDAVKAETWLKAAVKQKYANAATALEEMYRDGKAMPSDPITAHAWRTMAYYLKTAASQPKGGYATLFTPSLSADDNFKAWQKYKAYMLELGLAKAGTPSESSSFDDAARAYFKDAGENNFKTPPI